MKYWIREAFSKYSPYNNLISGYMVFLLSCALSHSVMSDSWDPVDCSLPGSSVHGILQARILEWVVISFSRGSSQTRDQTQVSSISVRLFTDWVTWEALLLLHSVQFSSVQSLSHVWLLATPWITARQASLSITNSRSLLKHMSIESVIPSSHLILCCPLLLLPSIPPSIRVFSNESILCMKWPKDWSFSFSISPSN